MKTTDNFFKRTYFKYPLENLTLKQQDEAIEASYSTSGPNQEYFEIEVSTQWFKDKLEQWGLEDTLPEMTKDNYYTVMLQNT
jgi:hypothetical protein